MKLPTPFSIHDLRFTIWKKSSVCDLAANRKSPIVNRKSASGIALVITLILLSVTLVMAVAFLAIARRERNSVTTTTDTATARLATDTALAAAQAQIVANILASTNLGAYNYSLLVSTNYINPAGYFPGVNYPTNVNYDYRYGGGPLLAADLINNIANLYLLPRAPVFVPNRNSGANDFRFYLDLNRNGQFETNNPPYTTAGDPEWIGILERPDQPHSPNNKFVARYAFFAQPVGNGLDLNFIHNQVLNPSSTLLASLNANNDGYFRNEGVGTWELNLAAFLADLNTNQWNNTFAPYNYLRPVNVANNGNAFYDAGSLLAWRYADNFNTLATPWSGLLNALANGVVDGYTLGPLMTTTVLPTPNSNNKPVGPWDASDNTNRFFALPSELFDYTKSSAAFTNHLLTASSGTTNFYDRYTFYRMLDQLGTDSTADDTRMNLNYDNLDAAGNVIPGAETNCIPWTNSIKFFTYAADRMLQHYTATWATNYVVNGAGVYVPQLNQNYVATFNTSAPFGVTHIPVLVSNVFVYTPAVNRLLQLAANMYDATTNQTALYGKDYPHVFRPMFTAVNANGFRNIYIDGFQEVSSLTSFSVGTAPLDAPTNIDSLALALDAGVSAPNGNAYGVPWIIGAKKGFPSFNGFYSRNAVQLTRKLQITRTNGLKPAATLSNPTVTNQMFIMDITNELGFSFWNPYSNNYSGNLTVYLNDTLSMTLTNGVNTWFSSTNFGFNIIPTSWPGSAWAPGAQENQIPPPGVGSFISATYDIPFLPESQYKTLSATFVPSSQQSWEKNLPGPPIFPQFGLMTTNAFQAFILDGGHVIDYVQINGPNDARNVNTEINDPDDNGNKNYMWATNAYGNNNPNNTPTYGVHNQINVSRHPWLVPNLVWTASPGVPLSVSSKNLAGTNFDAFFTGATVNGRLYTNLTVQAGYTPSRTAWSYALWQANDPLVHYLVSDLNASNNNVGLKKSDNLIGSPFPSVSFSPGDRYQPWGVSNQMSTLTANVVDTDGYNLCFRDPLIWGSDCWDFPTGKLPNVGWLGRVHRGTPWQTVYLKQRDVLAEPVNSLTGIPIGANTWAQWTADTQTTFNNQYAFFDASNSAPVADRDLFDLFTATPSPNSTRGTLSVNQTHLAAWSALFSGVVALTNSTDASGDPLGSSSSVQSVTNLVISPAGADTANSALALLLNGTEGINATRATFTNADGVVGAFEHVGDILNSRALTEDSPFLNLVDPANQDGRRKYDISDEVYEWLPQQTLGLLRASSTPRYVIYCYGQTLRPAPNGIVTASGTQFGLCTNYQVTAESAARVVLRVDNAKTSTPHVVIESFNVLPPN